MKKTWAFALLILVFAVPTAHAKQTVWEMAESDAYGTKAGGMLGRGLINASTCFVDVIAQTVNGTKEGTPFIGTLTGLGGGIGCTALRATSGVLDVATFWVPGFNGIPVGRSYNNCLDFEATSDEAPSEQPYEAPTPKNESPKQEAVRESSPMDYVKK